MTRRLRIAVLNRHFGRRFGGAESYSVALVEALAARHELHVFAQEFDHPGIGIALHKIDRREEAMTQAIKTKAPACKNCRAQARVLCKGLE